MSRRAAIYVRISSDAAGEGLGVARQEADCRELVARKGWQIADVYRDNDVSAFSGRRRPAYQAMLQAVKDGDVDVVVAWHPDRLHRSVRDLEDFIDLLDATGALVVTCTAGDLDLATPEGRLVARIVGSVARKESEDKSRRIRRKHLELAEAGRRNGGRAFGYDGNEPHPTEAPLVLEATARVLAGESLWAIINDWTDRGVPTVRGAPWSTTALRTVLMSERIAGLRVHHGQIVGEAEWPAILDRDTWESLRAVLVTRTSNRRRLTPARSYLLTGGLARCGACEDQTPLVAAPRPKYRAYGCLESAGGCNRISVIADRFETVVINRLAAAVADGLIEQVRATHSTGGEDLGSLIAAEERKLITYARMLDSGEIGRAEWAAMREGVQGRIDAIRGQLAARSSPRILDGVDADHWSEQWDEWTFDQRRAALRALVDRVVVAPVGYAGRRFNPDRVQCHWLA